MAAPNNVQRAVLEKMPGYRIIMQWTHGALMVAPNRHYQDVKVIDTDGHVYAFGYYMSIREGHRDRPPASTLPPRAKTAQSIGCAPCSSVLRAFCRRFSRNASVL
jgi:hypothetical protein